MHDWMTILNLYLQTFGWAMVGTISMGIALIVTLKIFTFATVKIDEWEEIRKGNIACAVVLAAVIIALAIVVSSIVGGT